MENSPNSAAPPMVSLGRDEIQAHLAAIVTSSDDAIVSKGLDGIIRSWNAAAERMFGYTAEEVIGKPITILIPDHLLGEEEMILGHVRQGQLIDHYQTMRRAKDGRMIEVAVTVSPIRNGLGQIVGVSKVARDITSQRDFETLQAHLAAIVETSDDAIVSKNLEGIIRSWNKGAERIFGYTAEEAIGRSIRMLLPADRQGEEDEILSRLQRGERVDHFQTVRQTKSGDLVNVSVTISPMRDAQGRIFGASKIARDVTEQTRIQAALKEREEAYRALSASLEETVRLRTAALEQAVRELQGFTYSISHDLRAPIRAIVSTSHMLEEELGDAISPEARHLLERQARAGAKLAALVTDLLEFTRIGRRDVTRTRVDLAAIAADIVRVEAADHPERTIELQAQRGLVATADSQLMRLVMQNLIDNAIKFAKPEGPIVMRLGRDGDAFVFSDNGIGFEQEYAEKVFEPFERLHRDEEYPGTGIGLANVRRVVERHGGRVWAEGTPGVGAKVFITLP